MEMIASYNFILVDCRSQNELLTIYEMHVHFVWGLKFCFVLREIYD